MFIKRKCSNFLHKSAVLALRNRKNTETAVITNKVEQREEIKPETKEEVSVEKSVKKTTKKTTEVQ